MRTRSITSTSVLLGIALAASVAPAYGDAPSQRRRRTTSQLSAQAPAGGAQSPQAPGRIDVYVLDATAGPGGVDPAVLQSLPQLGGAQFAAFPHITLVSRTTVALGASPASVALPNNESLAITSPGRLPTGRYEVSVRINTASGSGASVQYSAAPNAPFFRVRMMGAAHAQILAFVTR